VPDVLDQNEIDALLTAIEGGEVDFTQMPDAGDWSVDLYDFRRPERVSKEHIRSLEALHEGFSRTLGAAISGFLRAIVDVRVASVEQCTYGEFILSLPNPTCFYLLDVKPGEGNMILELNPSIVFPILDRLLGGGREPAIIPERPVTEIEKRLVDRLVDRAMHALAETWGLIQEIELSIVQMETNPQLIQALPASEVVVLLTFEIAIDDASGMIHLCVPFAVVEPIMNKITRASRLDYMQRGPDEESRATIARVLERAPVGLVGYLAGTAITVGDLARLNVGDILKTDKPAGETLLLTVGGRPKYRGRVGRHRGKKALLITDQATARDQP